MFSYEENVRKHMKGSPSQIIQNMLNMNVSEPIHRAPIHESSFRLPLHYLDKKYIHDLPPTVLQDLELIKTQHSSSRPLYDLIFKPRHSFAKKMMEKWSQHFTSHIPFLTETQQVIREHGSYVQKMSDYKKSSLYSFDEKKMATLWSSIKEDSNFLDRYSFMEFDMLKSFNESASFLQLLSVINVLSPIATFLIPVVFLILPFFLLKLQGIPIDFSKYMEVFKEIAKHHVIGKTITTMENVSINSIAYLFISVGLYFLQIYQNVISLSRFYKNICRINENLYELKQYVGYSIHSMESFVENNQHRSYYDEFCQDIQKQACVLKQIEQELSGVQNGGFSLLKMGDLGYMLRCYYILYEVKEYEESMRFSFGFEGYVNNINGLFENVESKYMGCATYDTETAMEIKKQYYPPYINDDYTTNSCQLDKNMVITGVNASGKTTYLKTTTINIICSQQFGWGFYDSCRLHPYTHIHSYLNIPDTSERDSLFQAESRRCKEILDIIGDNKNDTENRHFCIFDELYSGTNPSEATKTAYAFLSYLSEFKNVDFILTTHYTSICKKIREQGTKPGTKEGGLRMRNYKMNVEITAEGKWMYTYKLKPGVCRIKGAFEILKNMNYPEEILNRLTEK